MMHVDVKIIDPRMVEQLPAYATPGSAGLDLRAWLGVRRRSTCRCGVRRIESSSNKPEIDKALRTSRVGKSAAQRCHWQASNMAAR